ncbi:MAG: Gfo/Idh/MocA family oxidoreductase [Anaerolineales bacterium]
MQIKPVKTAIVGCGMISDAYLSTMTQKFKILEVVGCCDLDEAKAQAKAQEYGIQALTMEEILADPNQFGGEVRVVLKGNNEPVIVQQSHAFTDEYRGLGVAEMAWSMRMGRKNRANKEMAYHALEVLHGIVKSSQTKTNQIMQSTFEKTPPIPRGYSGQNYFEFMEEISISL